MNMSLEAAQEWNQSVWNIMIRSHDQDCLVWGGREIFIIRTLKKACFIMDRNVHY